MPVMKPESEEQRKKRIKYMEEHETLIRAEREESKRHAEVFAKREAMKKSTQE